jgi:hypothetical protein
MGGTVPLSSEKNQEGADVPCEGDSMTTTTASNGNLISMPIHNGNAHVGRDLAAPDFMPRGVVALDLCGRSRRRRRMNMESGRAVEMLAHAIEYLADEFALDCMQAEINARTGRHPQIEAIHLLMARNREIYMSCPEIPTLGERMRSLLNLRRA